MSAMALHCCAFYSALSHGYLSSPAKNSSNHVTRRILTGIEAKCEGSCCEDSWVFSTHCKQIFQKHIVLTRHGDKNVVITEARNRQHTRSPEQNLTLDFMLPQNKIRRNHERCFFMKKTGSMPCTGTETTTKTNAMLNTLKLRRVIGLKLRPNDGNISVQHFATLSATKKFCRNLKWMKLFHPSLSPFCLPH